MSSSSPSRTWPHNLCPMSSGEYKSSIPIEVIWNWWKRWMGTSDDDLFFNLPLLTKATSRFCTEVPEECVDLLGDAEEFEHQVAGHTNEIIRQCRGMILKPMIKRMNFLREVQFYEDVRELGSHSPQSPASFIPRYFGAYKCYDANGKPFVYLALENIIENFSRPCIMDLKIGKETFEPSIPEERKIKRRNKYIHQETVGFRITGCKTYNCLTDTYVTEGKAFGRSLNPDQVRGGLAQFFQNGEGLRRDVIEIVLQKLDVICRWASRQNTFHMYCSSILIAYDGLSCTGIPLVDVKVIDFAHTLSANGVLDEGYRYGVESLISHFRQILSDVEPFRK